ncbi:hypothetical protein [Pseudomonas rubra]|uniref:Uncharacterized protein n=1 Tax=Pseudomonas rubra TaxID=2942627 RepID=A0ABT5PDE8_9PSED|nr:hypothetical protein [Pseudomonas rubra]MDD1015994.1 hypothetical protein [Pseudomonas rubra]MDD1039235.1 hypothetical protein [Pseudomonas rubra]MDD1155205.1 hypothetical protein [Pseudomonas rubra]
MRSEGIGSPPHALPVAQTVHSLEARMGPAPARFDGLYQQLLSMGGQGAQALYRCIRGWPMEQGSDPAYRTVAAQLAVVLQVLQQLKADGLEEDVLYQEMRGVHTRVFGVELQMKAFLQQAMNPQWDEDSREEVEW